MKNTHIDGFILAAGEGRRLRPTTLTWPKALFPFCGVPLLELVASQMSAVGIRRIVINACHLRETVAAAVDRLCREQNLNLAVSREERLLDTGGGLRHGIDLLPGGEHLLVHNADVVLDADLHALVDEHLETGAAATLLLVPGHGALTVDLAPDGRIADFRRPHGQGQYTFSGVHILNRQVLAFLPEQKACSIVHAYEAALAAGLPVMGKPLGPDAYWADVGTAHGYIRAHGHIADRALRYHPRLRVAQAEQARRRAALEASGVRCTGALGLGDNLAVPEGAHVHNVVLWDNALLPKPLCYADGIFTGRDSLNPPPLDTKRQPDPRVFACLDLSAEQCSLTPLLKQGSGRRYCRLSAGKHSWVWCAYSHRRRENSSFTTLAHFLESLGIRVPSVELHLADVGEIVSRDLGEHDLQQVSSEQDRRLCLEQVADQAARLHVLGDRAVRLEELPLQNGFTKGLYDWERDYFREHNLAGTLHRPDLWTSVADEYCELRTRLLSQPLVPIHRDLQSANIMLVDGKTYLIDFQGMRLGCAAYDMAALLYDPYRCYPAALRDDIWRCYAARTMELGGTPPDKEVLRAAALQRLLQALGAYGKLWRMDGLDWYRQFIVPGFDMLVRAAEETDRYPAFRAFAQECLALAQQKIP